MAFDFKSWATAWNGAHDRKVSLLDAYGLSVEGFSTYHRYDSDPVSTKPPVAAVLPVNDSTSCCGQVFISLDPDGRPYIKIRDYKKSAAALPMSDFPMFSELMADIYATVGTPEDGPRPVVVKDLDF